MVRTVCGEGLWPARLRISFCGRWSCPNGSVVVLLEERGSEERRGGGWKRAALLQGKGGFVCAVS